jgi:WD40 repeat protein
VNSVAFGTTPAGQLLLASGTYDGTVRLWDPASSVPVVQFRRRSSARLVEIFGRLLAIGDDVGVCVIEPLF